MRSKYFSVIRPLSHIVTGKLAFWNGKYFAISNEKNFSYDKKSSSGNAKKCKVETFYYLLSTIVIYSKFPRGEKYP